MAFTAMRKLLVGRSPLLVPYTRNFNLGHLSNEFILSKFPKFTSCIGRTSLAYNCFSSQARVQSPITSKSDAPQLRPSAVKMDALKSHNSPTHIGLSGNPALLYSLNPIKMLQFGGEFIWNFRYFFLFMARTTFQALRPLLAFSVLGEVLKIALATMSSGFFAFCVSFVLAFEVVYFFLQCYISYIFLTMFFTVMF